MLQVWKESNLGDCKNMQYKVNKVMRDLNLNLDLRWLNIYMAVDPREYIVHTEWSLLVVLKR